MKQVSIIAVITCLLVLTVGCGKKEGAGSSSQTASTKSLLISNPKKAAPLENLTFVKGDPATIKDGHVYVVEFWATWCPPCLKSIPHLTELQHQFKDDGVTIIGVSSEALGTVRPFVENMGDKMDYTVAVDTQGTIGDGYMMAYKQGTIPTAFIVDGAGDVVWYGHPMANLDEAIAQVLEKATQTENAVAAVKP